MWGVVPEDMKAKVAANLANKVQKDGCHVDVGVLGCKALLNACFSGGCSKRLSFLGMVD